MPNEPNNHEKKRDSWTVYDAENDNARHFGEEADAEERIESAKEDFGIDAELYPPGQLPGDDVVDPVEADVVDHQLEPQAQPEYTLDERTVAEDPLDWVPQDFVDTIDGTQAINRKGFEVLSHFYSVDVEVECDVPPEETGFEYCRVKAVATTDDDRTCEAFGTSHVERGDDAEILLEMADTRARKRALSIATGVGAVAVSELKSEVDP